MRIIELKLEDAKSYENATIAFTSGVNAIVGQNGAGKSTILEAIGLTIFDELAYKQSDFVRAGARSATVSVTFESNFDERQYEVVRRVGSSNQHYIHDPDTGLRICEGKADVLAFLRTHLGIDDSANLSSMFRDAIGVPQGTFTAAFQETETRRKNIFEPLLQVQDYRTAFEKLRPAVRLLEERRQAAEVSVANLEGRLQALPELEQVVQTRAAELAEVSTAADEARDQLQESVKQRTVLENVREKLASLRSEKTLLAERQQAIVRELGAARQALADAQDARKIVEDNQSAYDQYIEAKSRQRELDEKLRQRQALEKKNAQNQQSIAVAENTLRQLEQDLAQVAAAEATMSTLQDAMAEQKQTEETASTLREEAARLGSVEESIEEQNQTLSQLGDEFSSFTESAAQRDALQEELKSLKLEEEGAAEEIEKYIARNASIKTKAETAKEQTAALQDVNSATCPICEQPLTEQHRQEMVERNEKVLADLREEYVDIQQRIKELQEEDVSRRQRVERLEKQLNDLPRQSDLARVASQQDQAKKRLDSLLQDQKSIQGVKERIRLLEQQLNALNDPKRRYDIAASQASRKEAVLEKTQGVKESITGLEKVHIEVEEKLREYSTLDDELDACSATIEDNEDAYQLVLSNRRPALKVEEHAEAVERTSDNRRKVEEQAAMLSEQIDEISKQFDEDEYQRIQSEESEQRTRLGALEARIQFIHQEQENDLGKIQELKKLQVKLEQTEEEVQHLTAQYDVLETIRNLLKDAGPYVTRVLINQISDKARQIFYEIMQDYSRHLSWKEDYGIYLDVDGHEREFSQLSGGEQMSAALAVRLALLRELSDIDVAFFDEPTADLDEMRRESLAQQILEVKGFSQLFVISHDDTFEQATQNLIRIEKVNGASVVADGRLPSRSSVDVLELRP